MLRFPDDKPRTFRWQVSGTQPDGTEWTMRAVFEELRQDELDDLVAGNEAADEELVRHALVGWGGVLDAGGEQVPFSPEAAAQLLQRPRWRLAVAKAYCAAILGGGRDEGN